MSRLSNFPLSLLVVALLLVCGPVSGQSPATFFSGTVADQHAAGIAYASVSLLAGGQLVRGDISGEAGEFSFTADPGTYALRIEHLEYADLTSDSFTVRAGIPLALPPFTLAPAANDLGEVTVTGRKALVEVRPDKLVFNVAASPSASGTNGLDLLRQAPGVRIDLNTKVSLPGKHNVRIYLNGVPTELAGNELVNLLQGMTSDNIEAIEIVANPSAKYEASGDAVINILTKKNTAIGFKGSAGANFRQGMYHSSAATGSLNYGGERVKVNFDATRSFSTELQGMQYNRLQDGARLDVYSREVFKDPVLNLNFGIEGRLSEKHTLNLTTMRLVGSQTTYLRGNTDIYESADGPLTSVLVSGVNFDQHYTNFTGNLNHAWAIDDRTSVVTTLSVGRLDLRDHTVQPNTFLAPDRRTVLSVEDVAFRAATNIDLASARVDLERSWEALTLSAGVKYARIVSGNDFRYFDVADRQEVFDPMQSSFFQYTENVAAAYASASVKLSPSLNMDLGLRVEHTESLGELLAEQDVDDKTVPRSYTGLFPNLNLTYDPQNDHTLSLSFGRRIIRPDYMSLNPFQNPLSKLVIWTGNPFLRPAYPTSTQLTYAFRGKLIVSANYDVTNDFVANVYEITDGLTNQLIPRNLDRATALGLSISYPLEVTEGWDFVGFFDASHQRYAGDREGQDLDLRIDAFSLRLQTIIKLPHGAQLDLTGSYVNRYAVLASMNAAGNPSLAFGLRKDLLNDRLQLRITGADIFGTNRRRDYTANYGGIRLDGVLTYDTQRFGAGFTYNFGNQQAQTERDARDGLEVELERTGY